MNVLHGLNIGDWKFFANHMKEKNAIKSFISTETFTILSHFCTSTISFFNQFKYLMRYSYIVSVDSSSFSVFGPLRF